MLHQAQKILEDHFGYPEFRYHQATLIEQVLARRDVLGVMPTGAGKSLVYQVPALVFEGITLVVSPLISLMKDQVDTLRQMDIAVSYLNSTLLPQEQAEVLQGLKTQQYKLLYVAPERLEDPRFLSACKQTHISLVAVDEAHCVSQWGKDFRPSYTKIAGFIEQLPKRPCVCALTATATDEVRRDITDALKLQDPYVCVAGFDRENLYFGVQRPEPSKKKSCLLSLLKAKAKQSGIVYCSTRLAVDEVAEFLEEEGYRVAKYHAGLSDAIRKRNQENFLFDRKPIMVATNAFGMGIDKSNVSFVIHYNMPRDLESYYQEAGRAGRDGSSANCTLIYNKKDVQTANFFAQCGHDERLEQGMEPTLSKLLFERDLERVRKMTIYSTTSDCLRSYILRYFGEREAAYRCEHCSSCEASYEILDATVDVQKLLSCILRLEQRNRRVGRTMVIDILRGSESQKVLQAGFDTLSTYGLMKDASKPFLHTLFDALLVDGLLQVSTGDYPVVSCTAKGQSFLVNKENYSLKVAKVKLESREEKGKTKEENKDGGAKRKASPDESDEKLFEQLKELRFTLAQEQQVPAFIVFHDSTLREMSLKKPKTEECFLDISGVGKKKAELYAEAFLVCIAHYLDQK